MTNDEIAMGVREVANGYSHEVSAEFEAFYNSWKYNAFENETHEVIGGMLARQITLAIHMASSPALWNPHLAPLVLRAMADNYISLAWICKDPLARSQKFIRYGLGQEKLMIEHRKAQLAEEGKDPNNDPAITVMEQWVNSQRYTFLLEVNIGSWSGLNAREMAAEAGCSDFYQYVYVPFSASAHSTWQHISRMNLVTCENPLHRFHRVPVLPHGDADIGQLELAAKYANKAIELCKATLGISTDCPDSYAHLLDRSRNLFAEASKEPASPDNQANAETGPTETGK